MKLENGGRVSVLKLLSWSWSWLLFGRRWYCCDHSWIYKLYFAFLVEHLLSTLLGSHTHFTYSFDGQPLTIAASLLLISSPSLHWLAIITLLLSLVPFGFFGTLFSFLLLFLQFDGLRWFSGLRRAMGGTVNQLWIIFRKVQRRSEMKICFWTLVWLWFQHFMPIMFPISPRIIYIYIHTTSCINHLFLHLLVGKEVYPKALRTKSHLMKTNLFVRDCSLFFCRCFSPKFQEPYMRVSRDISNESYLLVLVLIQNSVFIVATR